MWDFEHPPLRDALALRYQIERMSPSDCAARLALSPADPSRADIGLIPIAALAANPTLRILPGCTIASKDRVRSLLLVRRASQPLTQLRSVAADTASRTTVAYARILFHHWGNPNVPFLPHTADLDAMLDHADAQSSSRPRPASPRRTRQPLRAHRRRAHLPRPGLGVAIHHRPPFVSAVWAIARVAQVSMLRPGNRRIPLPRLPKLPRPRPPKPRHPGHRMVRPPPHPRTNHPHLPNHQHPLHPRRRMSRRHAHLLPNCRTLGILPEYTPTIPNPSFSP